MRISRSTKTPLASVIYLNELRKAGHDLPSLTHLLVNDKDEIQGAICDEYAPMLFLYWDPELPNPLAVFRAWMAIEKMWKEAGHKRMIIAIQEESPFYPYAEKASFTVLGDYRLMSKTLIHD